MTVNIAYASTTGGHIRSMDANYTTCRNGASLSVFASELSCAWGQAQTGGTTYWVYETFESFSISVSAADSVVASYVQVVANSAFNPSFSRALQWYEYDWGSSLDSGDWRNAAWWSGKTVLATDMNMQMFSSNIVTAGSDALTARIQAGTSPLRMVTSTDRQVNGYTPSIQEDGSYRSADTSGTSDDPALVWLTIPTSTLSYTAQGSVRLSDGTWAYLSPSTDFTTITLRHRTDITTTVDIATVPLGTSTTDFYKAPALQGLALVRDNANNLYVIGPNGAATGSLSCRAYTKGAGYSWSSGTLRTAALPAHYSAGVNNISAAWHNAGTSGTIMVVAAHGHGTWHLAPSTDTSYALLNCQYLLTGSGSLFRNSGSAIGTLIPNYSSGTRATLPANICGSGLDVQAPPNAGTRGYLVSWGSSYIPGENGYHYSCRYILASDGTSISSALIGPDAYVWSYKDPNAKMKTIPISDTQWAVITTDSDTGYGISIVVFQNVGTSSTVSRLGWVTLDGAVASMPAAATIAATGKWDAVYDTAENKIWVYYVDTANARRLVRTSVDMSTYLTVQDEIEIDATLGTGASSVCLGIRAEHNARSGDAYVLVACAIETGGVYSTDTFVDAFNQAPTAPTLTTEPNFDATCATTFEWTFNDPNAGATQSAFEVDINTSAGVDFYDTGKLSGVITYVGAGAGAAGNNASLAPALPAGWASGDLLLILASIRSSGTGTVNTPSGWAALVTWGNVVLLGRIAKTGDTAPTVAFTGGSAGDDTLAQCAAFRGTDQSLSTVVETAWWWLNASGQNIAYPSLTISNDDRLILWLGWKQDDWTSVAALSGAAEIGEVTSTAGSDAGQVWDYQIQTTSASITNSSFAVTGGGAAISRGLVVCLRPHTTPAVASFTLPASMLANGSAYQWRARTWDEFDATGAWADYLPISCSAGGAVTITDPATDDPAGVITDDYSIAWSVAGTTQAAYRVVVSRADTGAVLTDTGWVTSVDTSYTVAGMLSDVRYMIAVTVRNAALVESGTGTRYVTPAYSVPEAPTVTVTAYDAAGYNLITVTNPDPGTVDLGTSADGFEAGAAGYTTDGCAFTATSAQAYTGAWSAAMAASASPAASMSVRKTDLVPIVAGSRYTVSSRMYATSAYTNVYDALWWHDSSSAALSSTSAMTATSAAAWTFRAYSAEAPVSAAYVSHGLYVSAPSASQTLYVDELLLALTSDKPVPTGNQIHRRRADGTGDIIRLADETEVAEGGSFRDYTAGSGIEYEYRARAVATTGVTDSVWTDGELNIQGVWVHDPLDPANTIEQFLYGRSARSGAIDVPATELQFAGRRYPVREFGQRQDDTWSVRVLVPFGPTWASEVEALSDFIEARRTLVFRDNRGRSAYSVLSGYRESDKDEGTDISFTVARVDYTETTVEA